MTKFSAIGFLIGSIFLYATFGPYPALAHVALTTGVLLTVATGFVVMIKAPQGD